MEKLEYWGCRGQNLRPFKAGTEFLDEAFPEGMRPKSVLRRMMLTIATV